MNMEPDFQTETILLTSDLKKNADNEIGSITDRIEEFDDRIFDLQGRSVSPENLRPGIYIRAGKKVLVK